MHVNLVIFASGGMGATTGDSGSIVELAEGSVLQDLVEIFLQRYGKELIGGSENYQRQFLSRHISLSVNAELIAHDRTRDVVLHDHDTVTIIPIITGG